MNQYLIDEDLLIGLNGYVAMYTLEHDDDGYTDPLKLLEAATELLRKGPVGFEQSKPMTEDEIRDAFEKRYEGWNFTRRFDCYENEHLSSMWYGWRAAVQCVEDKK